MPALQFSFKSLLIFFSRRNFHVQHADASYGRTTCKERNLKQAERASLVGHYLPPVLLVTSRKLNFFEISQSRCFQVRTRRQGSIVL